MNSYPLLKTIIRLEKKIQQLRKQYQGAAVIATEPVFNDMAEARDWQCRPRLSISIMNDTEPSVSDIKNFEDKLNNIKLKY